jgi:hypothetical protein
MSHIDKAIRNTDWELLAQQKLALIRLCASEPMFDGLLGFLDAIQDAAEADGLPVVWLGDQAWSLT